MTVVCFEPSLHPQGLPFQGRVWFRSCLLLLDQDVLLLLRELALIAVLIVVLDIEAGLSVEMVLNGNSLGGDGFG